MPVTRRTHACICGFVVAVAFIAAVIVMYFLVVADGPACSRRRGGTLLAASSAPNYEHVHLVLYSAEHPHCVEMYKQTRTYYHAFSNIKTIYYTFTESMASGCRLVDDVLFIAGTESYIPGILVKTVKALEYVHANIAFSGFLIRSNISTVVNMDNLLLSLTAAAEPVEYAGPLWTLRWVEPSSGLHDDRYHGLRFVSGTCIVFSHAAVARLLADTSALEYTLIDDVALGAFVEARLRDVTPHALALADKSEHDVRFTYVEEAWSADFLRGYVHDHYTDVVFYRNKSTDRSRDVENMGVILEALHAARAGSQPRLLN